MEPVNLEPPALDTERHRQHLIEQAIGADHFDTIAEVRRGIHAWLMEHPEDVEMRRLSWRLARLARELKQQTPAAVGYAASANGAPGENGELPRHYR